MPTVFDVDLNQSTSDAPNPFARDYSELKVVEIRFKYGTFNDNADLKEMDELIRQYTSAGYQYLGYQRGRSWMEAFAYVISRKMVDRSSTYLIFGKPLPLTDNRPHQYPYRITTIDSGMDVIYRRVMLLNETPVAYVEYREEGKPGRELIRLYRSKQNETVLYSIHPLENRKKYEQLGIFRGDREAQIGTIVHDATGKETHIQVSDAQGRSLLQLIAGGHYQFVYQVSEPDALLDVSLNDFSKTPNLLTQYHPYLFRVGSSAVLPGDGEALLLMTGLWSLPRIPALRFRM